MLEELIILGVQVVLLVFIWGLLITALFYAGVTVWLQIKDYRDDRKKSMVRGVYLNYQYGTLKELEVENVVGGRVRLIIENSTERENLLNGHTVTTLEVRQVQSNKSFGHARLVVG